MIQATFQNAGNAAIVKTLEEAGLAYKKVEADHYGVKPCPWCGHEGFKLTIHVDSGAWDCKVCGEKGNLITLRKKLDLPPMNGFGGHKSGPVSLARPQRFDKALKSITGGKDVGKTIPAERVAECEAALAADPVALNYLHNRGLTDETIKAFRLGKKTIGETDYLVIPHFQGDVVVNAKQRTLPPAEKSFLRVKGHRSILFNVNAAKDVESVFLCEGEMDTMSLVQLGHPNAVGTTTGAGSLPEEWLEVLDPIERVYIVYDRDEAGQKGAWERARQIGLHKVWNVLLPEGVKDINEFLQGGGTKEQFDALIAEAQQFDVQQVEHIGAALDALKDEIVFGQEEDDENSVSLCFDGVNKIVGRPRPGDRVDLMATPKTGKTSWTLQIAEENAVAGKGVLVICQEMPTLELARRIVQAEFGVAKEDITLDLLDKAQQLFADVPLYLTYLRGVSVRQLPEVLELIRDAVRRYNLRLVIYDNLQLLIRESAMPEQDTATASKAFKEIAMEEKFVMLLVVQPKRTERGKPVRPGDGKGSGALEADADRIICLHREEMKGQTFDEDGVSEGAMEPLTEVWAQGRYARGGRMFLWFEEDRSRFRKLTPEEVNAHVAGKK